MTCSGYHVTVLLLSILMRSNGEVRLVIVARGPSCPLARMDSWTQAIACLTPSPGEGDASTFHFFGPFYITETTTLRVIMASAYNLSYDDPSGPPPGSPPTCTFLISVSLLVLFTFPPVKYEGPWLSTQIMISSSVGIASFLIFSYSRTRWPLLFAPRTKLKGTCRLLLLWHISQRAPRRFLTS